MDTRWWSNQMSRKLVAAATATTLALGVLAGPALARSPSDGGAVTLDFVVTIDASAGDQFDPHVSGDLAAYTAGGSIDFYDFFSGTHGQVTPAADTSDRLSDVSNGKIVFSREDGLTGSSSIQVFDVGTAATTQIGSAAAFSIRLSGAIGSDTVAYIDHLLAAGGEVVVADIDNPTATTNVSNDSRTDGQPQVAPLGDLVVYQSCSNASVTTCDVRQAGWNGSSWVGTSLTNNVHAEENPDSDGVIVVYDSTRASERDIYWQSVGGDTEQVLGLAGEQRNPSVSAGLIAFESVALLDSAADLYVYEVTTNRLFQVTNSVDNETLNDVSVLPGGKVRMVWTSGAATERDVHGATFEIPPAGSTYAFGGFLQPVDTLPALNSMKAGAAVPVKFSLGGNQGLDIFVAGYPKSQTIACDSAAPVDGIEQTVTAGGSSLQYNALADVYTYIWKTDKAWAGTCRQLALGFADGTSARANFKFR